MIIPDIPPINLEFVIRAQSRWDNLIKPRGSLGRLEELVCRISAIQNKAIPDISYKRLLVFAADHGIAQEGTSAYPQEVTLQMVRNFLNGTAAISILARQLNIELRIVDMGVQKEIQNPSLIPVRIRRGTRNFLKEAAMTDTEMHQAIHAGIAFAKEAKEAKVQLLAGGDMGIGNTAAASAIFSSLLSVKPEEVTGYGAGLDEDGRRRKIQVLHDALKKWRVSPEEPLEILRHFGGFEIAALTGFYLGGAIHRIPTIVDGFICTAAAAVAMCLEPRCKEYLFFSHLSSEKGYSRIMKHFGLNPILDLGMRLGEGTGAAISMQILDSAVALFREMPTFEQAEVSRQAIPGQASAQPK
jgi:nicotinate-nucleotide--dimethylbenzimidazole phosphoribosyltransferase